MAWISGYIQGHDPFPKVGEPCQPSRELHSIGAQGGLLDV